MHGERPASAPEVSQDATLRKREDRTRLSYLNAGSIKSEVRTLPSCGEMTFQSVPSCSFELVAPGQKVPSKEPSKVLNSSIDLYLRIRSMVSKPTATDMSAVQTLSRPSVVARTLSELETVGCKIT